MRVTSCRGLSQWRNEAHEEECFHVDFTMEAGDTVLERIVHILEENSYLGTPLQGGFTASLALLVRRQGAYEHESSDPVKPAMRPTK